MKHKVTFVIILKIILSAILSQLAGSDLSDLTAITEWQNPAPGVWSCRIGNLENELLYTRLAGEQPRLEALQLLTDSPNPFQNSDILFEVTDNNRVMVRIPTMVNEKIYGFGLQFDGIHKTRKVLTLNVDHWARGGGRTHAPVPFYISSRGYGVLFNTARFLKVYVQVGNRKDSENLPERVDRNPVPGDRQPGPWQAVPFADAVEAQVQGPGCEVIVFSGKTLLDVVARYNLYCGGGVLPPLWGLGFWHRVPATFNAEQTLAEVTEFARRDFPLDVIGLEPGWMSKSYPCTFEWQKKRFPDPEGLVTGLLNKGIRVNLWENPYVSPDSRLYDNMYPLSGSHLVWLGLVPDYTLPEARRLLIDQHSEDHTSIGVSGYKIDEVDGYDRWLWPDHATFPSGTPAETMRQTYGLIIQNMLYNELFKPQNRRTYGLIRASNAAASAYPFVIYSDSYKHSEYIIGLSAASLCGILWTPEVRQARNDKEWLHRIQTVCFSPMAQLNAWASGKKPWSYTGTTDAVRASIKQRLRLLPYLYTAFADYHFKGIPPIRAMILETAAENYADRAMPGQLDAQHDPYVEGRVIERNDQFMFGPSILVAPLYEQNNSEREVHLPTGEWFDFYTGQPAGGDTIIIVSALSERTPLFVRKGSIIPMLSADINNTNSAYGHALEIRIYGTRNGTFDLYEDDGTTFDYQKGIYRIRRIIIREGQVSERIVYSKTGPMFGRIENVKRLP